MSEPRIYDVYARWPFGSEDAPKPTAGEILVEAKTGRRMRVRGVTWWKDGENFALDLVAAESSR